MEQVREMIQNYVNGFGTGCSGGHFMKDILEKWAEALSRDQQETMLILRERMESNNSDWASTTKIPDSVLDEIEQLGLIDRKALGSAAEFTSLGAKLVDYCTC